MLLAVDAGNSNVKAAFIDNNCSIVDKIKIETIKDKINLTPLKKIISSQKQIKHAVISSVVPEINKEINDIIFKIIGITPVFITNEINIGLRYNYTKPEMIGADRIANVCYAISKYNSPVLVCDFGTATTISVSLKKNEFSGGLIAPGIQTSLSALFIKSSRLPEVDIEGEIEVIGTSTYNCIRSGVYYMQKGFIKTVIDDIKKDYPDLKTICTGGFSRYFKDVFDVIEENSVLYGCYEINKKLNYSSLSKET